MVGAVSFHAQDPADGDSVRGALAGELKSRTPAHVDDRVSAAHVEDR
jgi:hypothetical protein